MDEHPYTPVIAMLAAMGGCLVLAVCLKSGDPVIPAAEVTSVRSAVASSGASPATAVERLVADELVFDFGEMAGEEFVSHAFVLRNISDRPVAIRDVRASCSCTEAEVESDLLAPGESTELYVTVDIHDMAGEVNRVIIVEPGDRQTASVELSIVGVVLAD
jgi:hypothetical protein